MAIATNDKNVFIATIALLLDDEEQQQKNTQHALSGQDHGFSVERPMVPTTRYSKN